MLLWSSGAAPGGDVGLVSRTCRRGTDAARDQHAVDLPGEVALQAADDLSLALALLCAPRHVLLGATISTHPGQADHVQRTVGLPVAYIRLRRCLTTFPEEASMGATPQRLAKEASLLNLWGLSLRPRSTVSRRCRYRCPPKRPAPGRPAPPADRGARPARLSPQRGPPNGGPPNGARTWWPWALH